MRVICRCLKFNRMKKGLILGSFAVALSALPAPRGEGVVNVGEWRELKVIEAVTLDREPVSLRVRLPDGGERNIQLKNLPFDARTYFQSSRASAGQQSAVATLETELALRRAEYVAAVNTGDAKQRENAKRSLANAEAELDKMRRIYASDTKVELFVLRARYTGGDLWDCFRGTSQQEVAGARAAALQAREDQDARCAEARARLKGDEALAAKNDADAMFRLAVRYDSGDRLAGVDKDSKKAREWCAKAAALGHVKAATALKRFPPESKPAPTNAPK